MFGKSGLWRQKSNRHTSRQKKQFKLTEGKQRQKHPYRFKVNQ